MARDGRGQVVEDWALADAERLRAAGWLEARTVNDTDDVAFFWTREAAGALDVKPEELEKRIVLRRTS